jgi:succinate dehydrogenase / fumarate reductase, flavoprotein subunit
MSRVEGNRHLQPRLAPRPGPHSLLTFAEAATLAAIERKESRGGHTRDDYPSTDPKLGQGEHRLTCRKADGGMTIAQEPLPEMPEELKALSRRRSNG